MRCFLTGRCAPGTSWGEVLEVARVVLDSLVEAVAAAAAAAAEIVGSAWASRMVSVVAVAVVEEGRVAVGEASEAAAISEVVLEDAGVVTVQVPVGVVGLGEDVLGSIGRRAVDLAFPFPFFFRDLLDLPRCILPSPPFRIADLRSGVFMDSLGAAAL